MAQEQSFLHTTHRTVSWFNKAHQNEELQLSAPFQRNPVWTDAQKAYLIDTILQGLPVPELYMVDIVGNDGAEQYTVVDGQQRIRACLDFLAGDYALDGEEIEPRWSGLKFDDLSPGDKQLIFKYKFVVRILPDLPEEELRRIFARLNRNVVALNQQELRNATYWGPFISAIQYMADDDPFWADSGLFSANDHRRMLDHEFISELAIGYLHWPQNKKDKLEHYYQLYEENFDARDDLVDTFKATTGEISQLLPQLSSTRWRKKSDFYSLFLALAPRAESFPLSQDERDEMTARILEFGQTVDSLTRLEEEEWSNPDPKCARYARYVAKAASDKANRVNRDEALLEFLFPDE